MNNPLTFDFVVDKISNATIITREFDAEVDVVWDAFTNSKLLEQWWAPKPWKAQTKKMDFKESGQWFYAMVAPTGEKHWVITSYLLINTEKNFTCIETFTDEEGRIDKHMPQGKREFTFDNKGKHTLVEIKTTYDNLADLDIIMNTGFKDGITASLENLDELLIKLNK